MDAPGESAGRAKFQQPSATTTITTTTTTTTATTTTCDTEAPTRARPDLQHNHSEGIANCLHPAPSPQRQAPSLMALASGDNAIDNELYQNIPRDINNNNNNNNNSDNNNNNNNNNNPM